MQPEFVTPESLLLDTAERLGRVRAGRVAVRVRLSRVGAAFRDPAYGRIAARMFDGLVAQYRCQVFMLTDGDIVATGKDIPFGDLDAVVYKLRTLFDADPLVHYDPYGPDDRFCAWYDLETDYDAFLAMAADAVSRGPARRPPPPPAIAPAEAERIVGLLSDEVVRPFIAAQAAVTVGADKSARLAFQEIFVSLAELAPRIAPGRDIARDRWLFQYICDALDARLLAGIQGLTLFGRELPVNLNLGIATVLSPAFGGFLRRFPQARVTVEFQTIDAFADLPGFRRAADLLHEAGHRAMIDGLTPLGLWMLAEADLPVDGFKLIWSDDLAAPPRGGERDPAAAVRELGPERIVLGRCAAAAAIDWGLRQGISTFQGHFVDAALIGRAAEPATAGGA